MKNIIKIKNLTKSYKMYTSKQSRLLEAIIPKYKKHTEFKALDNLSLEVEKGEILGVLGRNGAGKSTLLKIITGVATQTSGELEIDGRISSLLELGAAFNSDLTGEENIYQHGQVMGLTKQEIESKKQEIIDFADIGDHLYQPVKTYSSGMFARLAFACAINVEPDILIVDEVLSVGDMAFQLKCFKKFQEFKDKGRTILFVTHSINDVIRNCTRTIILSNGKKVFDGSVKEGVELYKKMMVGIDIENEKQEENISKENENQNKEESKENKKYNKKENKEISNSEIWKENFSTNEELLTYGSQEAQIIDYGIFGLDGKILPVINNTDEIIIKMKVKFNNEIENPIFAMSIKDFKGLELAGSNTEVNKINTGKYKKGDEVIIEFRQAIPLESNKYTISFGCTKFNKNGDLEVFDRKYDALFLEIISDKPTLGLVEMNTKIEIKS